MLHYLLSRMCDTVLLNPLNKCKFIFKHLRLFIAKFLLSNIDLTVIRKSLERSSTLAEILQLFTQNTF